MPCDVNYYGIVIHYNTPVQGSHDRGLVGPLLMVGQAGALVIGERLISKGCGSNA